ncbi:MAG: DUF1080 domain-containing protein [Kiritimatiellia bacterium]|jgi:hypothetical protein|nr:DUF1080 domain-containing protein [Kiritimatiellia bacterium]MDD4441248.1 DUF1080 domain-containing protein [Kiritimatiellia bacterium]NLC79603.1 DUF1080 domain-containing protein [Lentisphaerota bacterium]
MKHLLSMVAVMVGATTLFGNEACCAAVNLLTEQERQEGWRLLWDGKSGDGWRSIKTDSFPARGWEIANGELTVLPKNAGGGAGDIITRETYSSFILKVDFRLTDAANSGIKYFFDPKRNGGTTLEYQVLDAKHPDATKGRDGNRTVASLYDVMPAAGAKPKPVGEWNTAMIVSKGRQVEHWLNGEKVLAFERGSDAFRKAVALSKFSKQPNWGEQEAGHILLQDHQDRVSYRNIKIKILK